MSKAKSTFICQGCGYNAAKWLGRCPDCGEWNSFVEELLHEASAGSSRAMRVSASPGPVAFNEIESQREARFTSGIAELDRVLGGGIVPGSLVLIGGDPGIGKSTLLLQTANLVQNDTCKVLYVSGEESERQIRMRGERLGIHPQNLFLLTETCLEKVLEQVDRLDPQLIILDSIQTVYSEKLASAPGSVSQVREAATQFLFLSKQQAISTFLIGHITKEGTLAGPKVLEHVVDTVLYFEGERYHSHRLVRTVKNRFGAANELGVFEMTNEGLLPVENPSKLFLAERPLGVAGSAVFCCMEGSRPILVEIQALVSQTNYPSARRMAAGVDPNRVSLLIAMLEKRLGLHLLSTDVYVNVAGGLTVDEPAADLAIVAAIVSSYRNRPVDPQIVILGEVGLAGEVRGISQIHLRLREAASMGFQKVLLPHSSLPKNQVETIQLLDARTVVEAFEALFG